MDTRPPPCPERDEAFRLVGRNLANFQKLEFALKELIRSISFGGSETSFESNQRAKARELKRDSLGDLYSELHKSLFAQGDGADQSVDNQTSNSESSIAFNFRIEAPKDYATAKKKRWLSIVKERNRLVHTDLLNYNLRLPSECVRLSQYLEEQNLRIHEAFTEIIDLEARRSSAAKLLSDFLISEEFRSLAFGPENDA
jgi:hypothetical protein